MEIVEYDGLTLHRWNCGASTFLARPELGARLINWNLRMADGRVRDVIHWPEKADHSQLAKVRGGNPILFPFSARTYHKGTLGKWKDRKGKVRPMPMHGFARTSTFQIVGADDRGFIAELVPDEAAQEAYPFDYRFTVRYAFSELSLKVFLKLENKGAEPILWSAGHHFYFTLPWHRGLERKDYRFDIPARKCYTHAPNGALEEVKPFKQLGCFGDPEASDRIFTKLRRSQLIFGPQSGEEDIGIRLLEDSSTYSPWNAFILWTEADSSPFYCVEPWMGPPNSPEHGKGLHAVSGGESAEFGVEVALL
ncbi:MAG: aldose epimerase [Opitutales bacterium]